MADWGGMPPTLRNERWAERQHRRGKSGGEGGGGAEIAHALYCSVVLVFG